MRRILCAREAILYPCSVYQGILASVLTVFVRKLLPSLPMRAIGSSLGTQTDSTAGCNREHILEAGRIGVISFSNDRFPSK